jgi:hypothetical protein
VYMWVRILTHRRVDMYTISTPSCTPSCTPSPSMLVEVCTEGVSIRSMMCYITGPQGPHIWVPTGAQGPPEGGVPLGPRGSFHPP